MKRAGKALSSRIFSRQLYLSAPAERNEYEEIPETPHQQEESRGDSGRQGSLTIDDEDVGAMSGSGTGSSGSGSSGNGDSSSSGAFSSPAVDDDTEDDSGSGEINSGEEEEPVTVTEGHGSQGDLVKVQGDK